MSNKVSTWVWEHSMATRDARLVLVKLADIANDDGYCWPSVGLLAKQTLLAEKTVRKALQKLNEIGELQTILRPGTSSRYRISINPNAPLQKGNNPSPGRGTPPGRVVLPSEGGTPLPWEGETPLPSQGRGTINEPSMNHQETINGLESFSVEADFERFWKEYPRRVAKDAALQKFVSAVRGGTSAEIIISAAARFAADPNLPREKNFIPHPTTWLNQKRWNDDALPARSRGTNVVDLIAQLEAEERGGPDAEK